MRYDTRHCLGQTEVLDSATRGTARFADVPSNLRAPDGVRMAAHSPIYSHPTDS